MQTAYLALWVRRTICAFRLLSSRHLAHAGVMHYQSHQGAQILDDNERLEQELGNLGAGQTSGVTLPQGSPTGPFGSYEAPIKMRAG